MPPLCRNGFINEEGDVTCTTCITKRYIVEDGLCKGKCNIIFMYIFLFIYGIYFAECSQISASVSCSSTTLKK